MSVEPTDPPRYRCQLCKRVTYNPDDIEQEYCPCCGSADGLLPKDCEHQIQVTIHGKYGRGPMPVEFRDALVEMTRLVVEAVDRGELGRRPDQED